MLEEVVQVSVYLVRVVVSSDEPVAMHMLAPDKLLRFSFARAYMVPQFAVFFIQSVKVTVDPEGIVPAAFGTPACVSNVLMKYSPVAAFFRSAL